MSRVGIICLIGFLLSCRNTTSKENTGGFEFENFSAPFPLTELPYQLSDSALAKPSKDTLSSAVLSTFIPDSVRQKLLGRVPKIKYYPLSKVEVPKGETFFIVKATGNNRRAALLLAFDKRKQFASAMLFLVPDVDATTTQFSTIDNSYTISRNIYRKMPDDVIADGKDVYVYDADKRKFTLIVTDLLDEKSAEFINPIDTFPKKHKLAGDYIKDKRNIVSIRDGRHPNELSFFVHFEKDNGNCTGELKGAALLTSPTTAIYRQGGDACVLQLKFTASSVTLQEEEGCGLHRGVKCLFEGTFPRKKEIKPKEAKPTKKARAK
ncbi:MAG: hypothetical protein ICV66_00225 [Chitinophagaceae bacterium]|nr:hypothetical protein [Chitinophagaceae bacterium]